MKTVLLVDDDEDSLASLKMLLKYSMKGIKVVAVTSADDAIKKLAKAKGSISLVLSDVNLGSDYGTTIKRSFKEIPFIYLTGDRAWKSPDTSPVVYKPYNFDKLEIEMNKYLEESNDTSRRKILVVDDNANIRTLMSLILKDMGDISTARSVNEAVNMMSKRNIDLLITDVNLGSGEGTTIRNKFPKVPCIYMTGDTEWYPPNTKDLVVYKPFSRKELLTSINHVLSKNESVNYLIKVIASGNRTTKDVIEQLLELT